MRIPLVALALLAACAPPPRLPRTVRVAPPPRSWTERDLRTPAGPAVLPPGRREAAYPSEPKTFTRGVARPPESYVQSRTLRLTDIPARRILAILPALRTVPLRTGVWPGPARVVEHDSLGALIATGPVSLASLGSEVVCTGGTWPREVAVRLEAYVGVERGAVLVQPRIAVAGKEDQGCRTGVVGQDRVAAFALDVAAALRQAARMGMAVPIRPRP